MAITGIYQVSELARGDKDFSEIVEEIVKKVNDGHKVLQGNDQLDTFFVILSMIEDDSDGVNEFLTYAIRGIARNAAELTFDEKLRSMSEDMTIIYEEERAGINQSY